MEFHLYRSMWGVVRPWADALPLLPDLGFMGIEAPLPHLEDHASELEQHQDLHVLPMIFTEGRTVKDHLRSFRAQLEACQPFDPEVVNCHDGKDAWSASEANTYYAEALAIEKDLGLTVAHETHRGRVLYNPWTTDRLLNRFEDLRLCCDYSHWVCVCERLIDDQGEILAHCAERAVHIHARVGYDQGPQVADPRAPEYQTHLEAHERWWDMIWDAQQQQGNTATTLTPEFGPPPYLHTLPYTECPVADLWDICTWQGVRQAARFETRHG